MKLEGLLPLAAALLLLVVPAAGVTLREGRKRGPEEEVEILTLDRDVLRSKLQKETLDFLSQRSRADTLDQEVHQLEARLDLERRGRQSAETKLDRVRAALSDDTRGAAGSHRNSSASFGNHGAPAVAVVVPPPAVAPVVPPPVVAPVVPSPQPLVVPPPVVPPPVVPPPVVAPVVHAVAPSIGNFALPPPRPAPARQGTLRGTEAPRDVEAPVAPPATAPAAPLARAYQGRLTQPTGGSFDITVRLDEGLARGQWTALGHTESITVSRDGLTGGARGHVFFNEADGVTKLDGKADTSGVVRGEVVQAGVRGGNFVLTPVDDEEPDDEPAAPTASPSAAKVVERPQSAPALPHAHVAVAPVAVAPSQPEAPVQSQPPTPHANVVPETSAPVAQPHAVAEPAQLQPTQTHEDDVSSGFDKLAAKMRTEDNKIQELAHRRIQQPVDSADDEDDGMDEAAEDLGVPAGAAKEVPNVAPPVATAVAPPPQPSVVAPVAPPVAPAPQVPHASAASQQHAPAHATVAVPVAAVVAKASATPSSPIADSSSASEPLAAAKPPVTVVPKEPVAVPTTTVAPVAASKVALGKQAGGQLVAKVAVTAAAKEEENSDDDDVEAHMRKEDKRIQELGSKSEDDDSDDPAWEAEEQKAFMVKQPAPAAQSGTASTKAGDADGSASGSEFDALEVKLQKEDQRMQRLGQIGDEEDSRGQNASSGGAAPSKEASDLDGEADSDDRLVAQLSVKRPVL